MTTQSSPLSRRWSAAVAVDPNVNIDCTIYDFGQMDQEEILGRLQVGVATQRKTGHDLPSATGGDELDTAAGPVVPGEEQPVVNEKDPDDILGVGPERIAERISELTGTPNTDEKVAQYGGDPIFFGDKYFAQIAENPNPDCLSAIGLTPEDVGQQLPVADCTGDGKSCPVRLKIINKVSGNLSKLKNNDAAPARRFMPQLDHKDLVKGKKSKDDIEAGFEAGTINHKEPYMAESLDIQRWNKLAGLLKD